MKYVLFLVMFLFSSQAVALNCERQPSCEELNYSKDDDPQCADDGYILCPFDFSYKKCAQPDCQKIGYTKSEKSGWCGKLAFCPSDKTYTACKALCEVGDIYYSDGTCGYADDYDGTKIPVGVVYWVTDNGRHGKVINLKDLGREANNKPFDPANPYDTRHRYLYWGYYYKDLSTLKSYSATISTVNAFKAYDPDLYDGKGDTDKILAVQEPTCYYEQDTAEYYQICIPQAALAARDFYPPEVDKNDSKVGQGKWYLPALGELTELYGYDNANITKSVGTSGAEGNNKTLVNNTLGALKGKKVEAEKLTESSYWSSSRESQYNAWVLGMTKGYRESHHRNQPYTPVRVSLEF